MAKKKTKKIAAIVAAPKPPGYVFGRPTVYKSEFCARAVELGALGKSLCQISADFHVSQETLRLWMRDIPDFFAAMAEARSLSQAHWEDLGYDGMRNRSIDGGLYSRSMSARFPNDWSDRSKIEHTGKDGAAIEIKTDDGLKTLQAALDMIKNATRLKPSEN